MKNKIILIGGIPGSGKTTISKILSHKLNITHRIGTGFIRESLRAHLNKTDHPFLFNYTFRCEDGELKNHYLAQAKLVCASVNAIIKRAKNEGTSIIIEGSHLVPSLINSDEDVSFIILDCDDSSLKARLMGDTHSKRNITQKDSDKILELREIILDDAKANNIFIIKNEEIEKTIKEIINMND